MYGYGFHSHLLLSILILVIATVIIKHEGAIKTWTGGLRHRHQPHRAAAGASLQQSWDSGSKNPKCRGFNKYQHNSQIFTRLSVASFSKSIGADMGQDRAMSRLQASSVARHVPRLSEPNLGWVPILRRFTNGMLHTGHLVKAPSARRVAKTTTTSTDSLLTCDTQQSAGASLLLLVCRARAPKELLLRGGRTMERISSCAHRSVSLRLSAIFQQWIGSGRRTLCCNRPFRRR